MQVRAQLENVTNLQAPGDDFLYCIKVRERERERERISKSMVDILPFFPPLQTRCGSCGEVSEKWQYVSGEERVDVPHSRGACNMVVKCKLCGRLNTLGNTHTHTHTHKELMMVINQSINVTHL